MIELALIYLGFNFFIALVFFIAQRKQFESLWIICVFFMVTTAVALPLLLFLFLDQLYKTLSK